mgnify:CR=1 FL=1|tara:strand:- start:5131 stop:5781 length:651 start_codon:yes stop_codon:yes gene_type:complete
MKNQKLNPQKSLGIISGAGPMAGAVFLQQLISAYQSYGAWQDNDFPLIQLINYPFSDMLSDDYAKIKIEQELLTCINQLEQHCDYIIICCQTLHLFLPDAYQNHKLINIFSVLQEALPKNKLHVIASKTSAINKIHEIALKRTCEYIMVEKAQLLINQILMGKSVDVSEIEDIAEKQMLLLGCTEFSIAFANRKTKCIDPYPYLINKVIHLLQQTI